MLTKKELQWLDNRGKFSCWYCPDIPQAMCTMGERPAHCAIMDTDWKNAAEFEARVAAKLATDENRGIDEDCPPNMPFGWGRLKAARLAVEGEMDGTD